MSSSQHPISDTIDETEQVAPGDESAEHGSGVASGIVGYVIGLVAAGGLTAASFLIAGTDLLYGPGIGVALLVFAVAQMGIHLVFFLHITTGPDNTNNVLALAFGVMIVVFIIVGSLWIMANLDHNMMPDDMMRMMNAPL